MGHSYLEPAVHERRPWNVERNDGYKRNCAIGKPFTPLAFKVLPTPF